jgi:hypothetical protein
VVCVESGRPLARTIAKVRVNRQGREERQEVIHYEFSRPHQWFISEIRIDSWFKRISCFLADLAILAVQVFDFAILLGHLRLGGHVAIVANSLSRECIFPKYAKRRILRG